MSKYFVKYNANPNNEMQPDCLVRAMAMVTERTYDETLLGLAKLMLKHDRDFRYEDVWNRIMFNLGYRKLVVKHKPTLNKWCESTKMLPNDCAILTVTNNHAIAVKHGKFYDNFDSGRRKVVFVYVKERYAELVRQIIAKESEKRVDNQ